MEYMIGLGDIPDDYNENVGKYKKEWFGTRCDMGLTELEFKMMDERIHIVADSKWTPIIPFLLKLCNKYNVSAIIEYYEWQVNFGGRAVIDTSGIVDDKKWTYFNALFLYENKQFWKELDEFIKNIDSEYFEEFIRDQTYLGEKEIDRIILEFDARKFNL
jgi:hypothetical protein